MHLESSQKSQMELFCEDGWTTESRQLFLQKVPP